MAITFAEAKAKAMELNPKVSKAKDYGDAYVFMAPTKGVPDGGDSAFVIMKDSGKCVNLSAYMMERESTATPKTIPMGN